MPSPETVFFAISGGVLPALLWLWFWLKEDRLHPEPRGIIIQTFIAGMISVLLVLPLEQTIQKHYSTYMGIVVILWACAEELFKWGAAYFGGIETREYDEPIDAVIYMLTAALGFAAMENTLFLMNSITHTNFITSFVTGNLRFVGATLLHVLSSGVIGFFMGISFNKSWVVRKIHFIVGLVLAIILHTAFNGYIMNYKGANIFIIFCFVWVAVVLLIAGFEKIKRMKARW